MGDCAEYFAVPSWEPQALDALIGDGASRDKARAVWFARDILWNRPQAARPGQDTVAEQGPSILLHSVPGARGMISPTAGMADNTALCAETGAPPPDVAEPREVFSASRGTLLPFHATAKPIAALPSRRATRTRTCPSRS